jgi:hypothetical protein
MGWNLETMKDLIKIQQKDFRMLTYSEREVKFEIGSQTQFKLSFDNLCCLRFQDMLRQCLKC